MPIQSEHIIVNKKLQIDVSATLVRIANALLDENSHAVWRFHSIDFFIQNKTTPLQIQLKHQGERNDIRYQLEIWLSLFNIKRKDVELIINAEEMTSVIRIEKPQVILSFFNRLEYESLLMSEQLCLAYRVDLLQLLIANFLKQIIKNNPDCRFQPESLEFDHMGHVSAVVKDARGEKYILHNTDEVCGFLRRYARHELSGPMIALVRMQVKIAIVRYERFMSALDERALPRIFAYCRIEAIKVLSTKQLSIALASRASHLQVLSPQDRCLFQVHLSRQLGARFAVQWRTFATEQEDIDHYLMIYASSSDGLTALDIAQLQDQLKILDILPEMYDVSLLTDLVGKPSRPESHIPEGIVDLLKCVISQEIPEEPVITPEGHTYDRAMICSSLQVKQTDPQTRTLLSIEELRPNLLVKALHEYYMGSEDGWDSKVDMPTLLINPQTKQPFRNPVVLSNGQTVDGEWGEQYSNRCIISLMEYYNDVTLMAVKKPVIRTGVRATIGANIGLLCPGLGALAREDAKNEMERSIPYVDYHALTSTLMIHTICPDYARRLYLGLSRWRYKASSRWAPEFRFSKDNLDMQQHELKKNIPLVEKGVEQITYRATVVIRNNENIQHFFKYICGLSTAYFDELCRLSGSNEMDSLNELLLAQDWNNEAIHINGLSPMCDETNEAVSSSPTRSNILSTRASADVRRAHISSQYGVDNDETMCVQASEPTYPSTSTGKRPASSPAI